MHDSTVTTQRTPPTRRPVRGRRVAGAAAGVLAVGGLGALVHDIAEPRRRPAVVVTPAASAASAASSVASASSGPAEASSVWSALQQLDAADAAAARAGLSPEVRAAVDELDRKLADAEAARRANPDTLGITEMYGAFWAAAPPDPNLAEMCGSFGAGPAPDPTLVEMCGAYWAALGTIGITEMYGAFWAPPSSGSTIGTTEMYGAFWAPAPLSVDGGS
jgi:hypothetical protein